MKNFLVFFLMLGSLLLSTINNAADKRQDASLEKTMDIHFNQIPVKELLRWLSEFLKINLVMSDGIIGNITVHLYNIKCTQAFDVLLHLNGLVRKDYGGVIFVSTLSELKQSEQQRLEMVTPSHLITTLNYANAEEAANLLKTSGFLSQKGQVVANANKNSLWVLDAPHSLERIKHYIKVIDIPEKQVLIEARIINVDCQIMDEFGLHFLSKKTEEKKDAFYVSLPEVSAGRWNFSIAQFPSPNFLDLELSALETRGKGKILACPKLITQNRKSASIESGEEIPYQEQTASGATSVNFKKAALSLKVTPQITSKSQIILSLEINQDKVSSLSVNGTPAIQMQNLKTQVRVKDGQTVVLGGIFEESKKKTDEQLPFLHQIPVVGKMIGDHHHEFSRKELLIFITPKILEDT